MASSRTPSQLRELGVQEYCGPDRAIPRAILGCIAENRKEIFSMYFPMVISGAAPEYGAPDDWRRKSIRHEDLAAMNGLRRETVTRRIGRCSENPRPWEEEKRRRHSEKMKEKARQAGKPIHNRAVRALAAVPKIFGVTPRANDTNAYTVPAGAVGGRKTKAAELLADRYGKNIFNPKARVNGFKDVEAYVYDPHIPDPIECECVLGQEKLEVCPTCGGKGWRLRKPGAAEKARGLRHGSLPDYARMLIVWYKLMGMGDEFPELKNAQGEIVRRHKPPGMLQMSQRQIAEGTGLCEDSVRTHNRKLALLRWIKIVPGDKYGRCPECADLVRQGAAACGTCGTKISGKLRVVASDPDKIIDLTSKLMDREMCLAEYERFMRRRQELRDQANAGRAEQIHLELLRAWEGKEHTLRAFWNEVLRRYAAAGIPNEIRAALIPTYRE